MNDEVIFSHCLKCGKPHVSSGHTCQPIVLPVMEHCIHCGGDYPVGQSHGCVSREAETATLLRQILREIVLVREEVAVLRIQMIARWGP
jgi:hypothetical protein